MSRKELFNDNWSFTKKVIGTSLDEILNAKTSWEPVAIPHDWLIYDAGNLYETGEGWYKKSFDVVSGSMPQRVAIRFDGVYMDSTVYINGKKAGDWKYGYTTFEYDITELLISGKNEIIVRVVHQAPNSRWYSGAGIYRNIWIKYMNPSHFVSDGIYISTFKQNETEWCVKTDAEINLDTAGTYTIKTTVLNLEGFTVAADEAVIQAEAAGIRVCNKEFLIKTPCLWGLDEQNLYTLKAELLQNGVTLDAEESKFGFREVIFDPNNGFIINGKKAKLYGVCQHHDLGCLGAAINKTALRRQLEMLKEMGVNAIRASHNPPAPELIELADEMGFFICSEAFDMWERSKTKYDYARFFGEWVEKDISSWIRRDRNHPSVIMWSIGNEIPDTHAGNRGQEITRMLKELVEKHDPRKNAAATIGSNYMPWENARKCADILKLAGYNYAEKYYNEHHKKYPDWIIYGSETASTVQSRGVYHFPLKQSLLADEDEQCSSLGNSSTSWGAKNTEACIIADRDAKFSLGQFIWTGFDYIGEPTPYDTKNSYFGQIDTAGFKKDSFYMYQSAWTDYKTNPMVHIYPYWDFSEGQLIDVRVCSNAPKIELFLDGVSIGTADIDHENGTSLTGDWQLPYIKGILRTVAYDENGYIIAEDINSSFGDAARLVLKPDKTKILADGQDLIFVEISAVDEAGIEVENANTRVTVRVTGAGRLVGLDNGDSTDYDQYKGTSRRLFSGKLLAVVAANDTSGEIFFTAESEGMEPQSLVFTACTAELPKGASAIFTANIESAYIPEIPVRKIELSCENGFSLNTDKKTVRIHAKLYPENATCTGLIWRAANRAGIDSNVAKISVDGLTAELTALGNGDIYLRCMTDKKPRVISQIVFNATGLGEALLDPYGFIAGGAYNASNTELGNGNDRGITTARDGESHVGFRNVNFGIFGSDTVKLPIFSLSSEELPIDIWEGMPNEPGSEKLCTVTYTKGSKWNTYIEETFTLPRRIKGITTICFVVRRKVHIKGFSFKKLEKAYEQICVADYSSIYGDAFRVSGDSVEGIGNNVTLVFDDMDFSGFTRLQICGRTPLVKNTIRLQFGGGSSQIIEFDYATDYVTREFELEPVIGEQNVSFIFLPGCDFDFKWFKFIKSR